MSTKRLFLFAAYNKDGFVGPALEFHVKALSSAGDVVVVMDNDAEAEELMKLSPFVVHAEAQRHNEYDFGSYKRAYLWSRENLNMDVYDYCYLVNDSVYGPLREISPYLEKMENLGTETFGLVINPHKRAPHIQSWFVGMGKEVFLSGWFGNFISSITRQEDMSRIYSLYEIGMTELFVSHGFRYDAPFRFKGKAIYNSVRKLYGKGLPFIKKSAFTRHNGSLGSEVKHVLDSCRDGSSEYMTEAAGCIIKESEMVYGEKYMDWFLRSGKLEMLRRHTVYLFRKITR